VARDKYGNKAFDGHLASNNKKKEKRKNLRQKHDCNIGNRLYDNFRAADR